MRKILNLTVIALLGVGVSAMAQDKPKTKYRIAKGSYMLTGGINGGYQSFGKNAAPGNQRSASFQINEQNGYFVANNFSIGLGVGYGYRYSKEIGFDGLGGSVVHKRHTHSPLLGFHMRYYKMFTEKFGFFGHFNTGVMYSFGRNESNFDGVVYRSKSTSGSIDVSVTPNLVYFVTPRLAIEGGFGRLGYSRTFQSSNTNVNLGVTPDLNISMSFFLCKGVQPKP